MGEEKPELNEGKLSSQSGYSPIKQMDSNKLSEQGQSSGGSNHTSDKPKTKANIPGVKRGKISNNFK